MSDTPLMHRPNPATARRVGLGRTKLFELMKSGEIQSVKVGRARLIPEAALVEYVERLREKSQATEVA